MTGGGSKQSAGRMTKLDFLTPLLGDNQVYEDIILSVIDEKLTLQEIHAYTKKQGHTYTERTIREKVKELQEHHLLTKEFTTTGDGSRICQYYIPGWSSFKTQTLDPIRRDAKRHIFDKRDYN